MSMCSLNEVKGINVYMEYCWDIEKIRKHRKDIKNILRKDSTLTKEQKEDLKDEIRGLIELELSLFPNKKKFSLPKREKYIDKNHLLPLSTYDDYFDIPEDIKTVVIDAVNCFQNFHDTYDRFELPHLELSNQELVDMSDDFYQWLPNKNYLQLYREYTNPYNHQLHFFPYCNSVARGDTIMFFHPLYTPYFSIYKNNTIDDFITLNHEIAHGIFSINDDFYADQPSYYLRELEGEFFNFLSCSYLKGKISNQIIERIEYLYFITQFNDFMTIYLTHLAIHLAQNKGKISFDSIQEKIIQNKLIFSFDKSILAKSLLEDPTTTANYSLSYLTSLDLEPIFEQDPEYAFYLFERIRRSKTNDIFQELRENKITFMDDGYQNLKKKMKVFGEFR